MQNEVDITIIGAGVIGLAIASELARPGLKVYILEKNESFGLEQSSRNSEVIHAGIYYERDSLKARLCLEGNALLYQLCAQNGIGHVHCGKLMIATDKNENAELYKTFDNGINNGVRLKMLTQHEIAQIEPNVKAIAAFHSPATGIIDSYGLLMYYQSSAREKGAQLIYKAAVTAIEKNQTGYTVAGEDSVQGFSFTTSILINCAGLNSDRVAEMAGIDTKQENYTVNYSKGEYYSVSGGKSKLINGLIYPVPVPYMCGIHVCLDIERRFRFGPYDYPVDNIDYRVDSSNRSVFENSSIVKALPFIKPEDLEPESAGIQAKLFKPGQAERDFIIRHEIDRGLPGLINLVGINSPGLTSSPAIAKYVSRLVHDML